MSTVRPLLCPGAGIFPLRLLRGQAHHPRFPYAGPHTVRFPHTVPISIGVGAAPEITPEPSPVPTPTESAGPDAAPVGAQLPGAWNDREAQVSFGMSPGTDCPLAVFDARVGLNDLSVSLVPLGSGPDIQSFLETDIRIPHTSVSYDSGADALVLRLENTVLETGDPAEAAGNDDWVFDFIGEHGLRYPHSFPMGSIGEDNRFFERAAISTDGTDTTITLRLTGKAMSYRVESGSLDGEGMLPYFRILFSEEPA